MNPAPFVLAIILGFSGELLVFSHWNTSISRFSGDLLVLTPLNTSIHQISADLLVLTPLNTNMNQISGDLLAPGIKITAQPAFIQLLFHKSHG
ncbi:hypothetical protein SAMN05878391_1422 [Salinicoccus kekensis]|uniref:Uncharacterized protein n=1 Tax=Salinicoccus kekensis TaxID=714307 RepID=A0A285UIY5_9STAP|nr:hypothetical protein SAMN05878391_1422 [Salinicoccus kekensis]